MKNKLHWKPGGRDRQTAGVWPKARAQKVNKKEGKKRSRRGGKAA